MKLENENRKQENENRLHESARKALAKAALMLKGLCIYRNLLADPVISAYITLVNEASRDKASIHCFASCYSDFFSKLSYTSVSADFSEYLIDRILMDENPFTISASFPEKPQTCSILAAAASDIRALKSAAAIPSLLFKSAMRGEYLQEPEYQAIIEGLPEWKIHETIQTAKVPETSVPESAISDVSFPEVPAKKACAVASELKKQWSSDIPCEAFVKSLATYHASNGFGIYTRKFAFTWRRAGNIPESGVLVPVRHPDPVRLSDLIAYESEREEVVRNTEQFLNGYPSNNVLLYGDRGTGKSSTVKALLNEYHDRGLRMVEVPKQLLSDFPEIVELLADKPYKFILFVDDLSFEDNEDGYTSLKAVIEGSLETKPRNVLIYATSNRRHLVRENFSDRTGLQYGGSDDEIRAFDTMQEKLSLSDRFGITVVFSSPDKKRFLEIVDKLAEKKGLGIDSETLHREALKWELWYNGRSPRTAQQFIIYISGKNHESHLR